MRAARDNARANGVARLVHVVHAAGLGRREICNRRPFDLVLANILLAPLRRLAGPVAHLTAPGARVVLSGLLCSHEAAALAPYRAHGFRLERRLLLDGWVTLVLIGAHRSPGKTDRLRYRHSLH